MAIIFLISILIIIVAGSYFSFQFAKYYIDNYILNGKIWQVFSKEFMVVMVLLAIAFILTVFFLIRPPDYFRQGVDQLHHNQFVKHKIGEFSSYSFKPNDLPKNPVNDAVFQIELDTHDTLYLTCTMKKVDDDWKLIKIQPDSLHKGHD